MHRIAAITLASIVAFTGQAAAQGPFDNWVWVSAHSQGCVDCTAKVPPSHPHGAARHDGRQLAGGGYSDW